MKPTLICVHVTVVLPDDTFVLGFHLQLSSGLCQRYVPVRYRLIKYCTLGAAKMWRAPSGTYCWSATASVISLCSPKRNFLTCWLMFDVTYSEHSVILYLRFACEILALWKWDSINWMNEPSYFCKCCPIESKQSLNCLLPSETLQCYGRKIRRRLVIKMPLLTEIFLAYRFRVIT